MDATEHHRPEADDGGPAVDLGVFSGPLDLLLHLIQTERGVDLRHPDRDHLRPVPRASRGDAGARSGGGRRVSVDGVVAAPAQVAAVAADATTTRKRTRVRSSSSGCSSTVASRSSRPCSTRRTWSVAACGLRASTRRWMPDEVEIDWEDVDLRVLATAYLEVMERFAVAHPPPLEVLPLRFRVRDKMRELYGGCTTDDLRAVAARSPAAGGRRRRWWWCSWRPSSWSGWEPSAPSSAGRSPRSTCGKGARDLDVEALDLEGHEADRWSSELLRAARRGGPADRARPGDGRGGGGGAGR